VLFVLAVFGEDAKYALGFGGQRRNRVAQPQSALKTDLNNRDSIQARVYISNVLGEVPPCTVRADGPKISIEMPRFKPRRRGSGPSTDTIV
jgi:hypothetical protein